MTVKTWSAEFYPVRADDPSIVTDLQAVQHSLLKWRGMSPEMLDKHGVNVTSNNNLAGTDDIFHIDAATCALCVKHMSSPDQRPCDTCPLFLVRGGMRCDFSKHKTTSPWASWLFLDDNKPMVEWLEKAEVYVNSRLTSPPV